MDEKISSLKAGTKTEPSTKGKSLEGFGQIEQISSVMELLKAKSSIQARAAAYKTAAKDLPEGIKAPPFKISGLSAEAWISDINDRIVLVYNKTQLDKLTQVKNKLESHLSEDMRLQRDLGNIAELLSSELVE